MNPRDFIEGLIIIFCGLLLLSPEFNIIYSIGFLSFFELVPKMIKAELAFALLPIAVVYLIELFIKNEEV